MNDLPLTLHESSRVPMYRQKFDGWVRSGIAWWTMTRFLAAPVMPDGPVAQADQLLRRASNQLTTA